MNKKIKVHYIVEDGVKDVLETDIQKAANIHTHGMEKFNLKNLCIGVAYSKKEAMDILGDVVDTIIYCGKNFDFNICHCFDRPNGKGGYFPPHLYVKFLKVNCCGENCYLIIKTDKRGIPLSPIDMFSSFTDDITLGWENE